MRFKLNVADRETGEEVVIELDALTIQEARQTAAEAGFVIASIEVVSGQHRGDDLNLPEQKKASLDNTHACPKCGNTDCRSVRVLYEEQTSRSRTTGSLTTSELGYNNGVSVSVGSGKLNVTSSSQTELAKKISPPSPPRAVPNANGFLSMALLMGGGLACIIVIPILSGFSCVASALGGLVGLVLICIGGAVEHNQRDLPANIEAMKRYHVSKSNWERKLLCPRCGNVFLPAMK